MKEIVFEFNKMPVYKMSKMILINVADHINYSKTE